MTKFLLTVIGEFKQKDLISEVALTLTPIVDSPHLKFQSSHGTLIFHFASEVNQEEIHDYIQGSLFGLIDSFILVNKEALEDVVFKSIVLNPAYKPA